MHRSHVLKQLINQTTDGQGTVYQTWAEMIPCDRPFDTVCLRFSSTWTGAKNPESPQVKAEFFLDSAARHSLQQLLGRNS